MQRALIPSSSKTALGHGLSFYKTPPLRGCLASPVPQMGQEKLGPLWVYNTCFASSYTRCFCFIYGAA